MFVKLHARYVIVASLVCLIAFAVGTARAQTTDGRIVGTIVDPTGSPMSGVDVKVRNLDTNAERSAQTTDGGSYVVSDLPIGNYQLTVEHSGFKRYIASSLKLLTGQALRVDVQLAIGNVQEQVEVTGQVPVIATDQSSLGEVMQNKEVVQLPLNGRNFLEVANLAAGSTQGSPNYTNRFRSFGTVMTSNGSRGNQNNYLLDGVDNTAYIIDTPLVEPSVDAIEEIKVQTANFTADMGQAGGAVVNVATKSGTNQFHGTLFEFLRNDVFDANNYFATSKPPLRQNQFGGSIGGPVIKNKLFFFFNYEGYRQATSAPYFYFVPTPAMKNGDFSGTWAGAQLPTLYDPLNVDAGGNRLPFANNVIPQDRISPIATQLLSFMPDPNSDSPAGNYEQNFSTPATRNQYNVRADYTVNSKDSIMFRGSIWNAYLDQHYLNFEGDYWHWKPRSTVLGWTHVYSPNVLQEVRFGFSRYSEIVSAPYATSDFAANLGLPEFPIDTGTYFPTISINNIDPGFGADQPSIRIEDHFQGQYHVSITHGRNTMKLGADLMRYQAKDGFLYNMGLYNFTGGFTGQVGQTYANGFGDLLLGFPASQTIQSSSGWDYERLRNTRVQSYIQDDWQANSHLTINLGLRWDWYGPWKEVNDRTQYFDLSSGEVVYPAGLKLPYDLPFPHRSDSGYDAIINARNKQFGPRVGFAWRPFKNDRTVVQGAFGLFWGLPSGYLTGSQFAYGAGLTLIASPSASTTVAPSLTWGDFGDLTNPLNFTRPGDLYVDPDAGNPYVSQWNLTISHEVAQDMALKVAYVGSRTTHLDGAIPENLAYPPALGNYLDRLPYQDFGNITHQFTGFWSTYHALQLSLEKHFSNGLMFTSNYTWSKCLDDKSDIHSEFGLENPYSLALEKGLCEQDVRYRWTTSFVYELPIRTSMPFVRHLVEGWQTSGVVNLQAGFPFSVLASDLSNVGPPGQIGMRADYIGGSKELPSSERSPAKWFNTAAFAQPAPYTFGNSGRDILIGPGFNNVDMSLMKVFNIRE